MENNIDDFAGVEENLLGVNPDGELEGLGRAKGVTFNPAQKQVAKQFATRRARAAVGKSTLSRGQRFFESKLASLPIEEQKRIASGDIQFVDGDFYVRALVGASGQQTVINSASTQKVGVTNINKGELPAGTMLALSRLRVAYGMHASEIDPAKISYSCEGTAVPKELLNGEIRINVNEKPVYVGRLSKFFSDATNGLAPGTIESHSQVVALESPKMIAPGDQIRIEVVLAEGLTIAGTDKHFLEVDLLGPATRPR